MAFFDADETLLAMKSMLDFLDFYLRSTRGEAGARAGAEIRGEFRARQEAGASRERLNADYYRLFAGEQAAEVERRAAEWFRERWGASSSRYVPEGVGKLRQLRAEGFEAVIVSGSFAALLRPFAGELGVGALLCAAPEARSGVLTGRLLGAPMIGAEKARSALALMKSRGADPARCFACGDDFSDIPLLESVGRAAVVGRNPELLARAAERGWELL